LSLRSGLRVSATPFQIADTLMRTTPQVQKRTQEPRAGAAFRWHERGWPEMLPAATDGSARGAPSACYGGV